VRSALRNLPWVVGLAFANTLAYVAMNRFHLRAPIELPLTPVDRALPFLSWTIWPYMALLFSDVVLPPMIRDEAVFRRWAWAFIVSMAINVVIWAVMPTVYPRPPMPLDGSPSSRLYVSLMGLDTPACCFPSAHISLPTVTAWALARQWPRARIVVWLGFAFLAVTILTTKQHYLFDLLAGLLSGAFGIASARWLARPVEAQHA
jgi:hypothetical protein